MSNDPLSVLVLGVGGNVSQGILKALALSTLPCRVVGACVSPLAYGLYTTDRAYVSPPAADPAFLPWLTQVCRDEHVGAVLSGVEPVLAILAQHADTIAAETGALVIVSRPECLAIGDDKLRTCAWLREQGFHFPRYAPSEDRAAVEALIAEVGFPLFAKPRRGKSAQGIFEVRSALDVEQVCGRPGYVFEEWLGTSDEEYTAGCFCDRDGAVQGSIVMRRELLEGTTVRAEVGAYPELRAEAERITTALRPMGPCNVQLRRVNGRPVCFEINVRFSGTTPLRARFGFNEVEAALRHYVLGEKTVHLPEVTRGVALRYWNEVYVAEEAAGELRRTQRLKNPHDHPLIVEDYGLAP